MDPGMRPSGLLVNRAAASWAGAMRRQIADTAVAGQWVLIRLQVRRFICDVAACTRRTFVEQADGLTFRYGRVTGLLHETLQVIAAALAGRPGARLAARTAIVTSRSTLLRRTARHLRADAPDADLGDGAPLGVHRPAALRPPVQGGVRHQPQ
jgi:hypothetical protein